MIVIGSGFGGLAAAIRLAARGHEVTVLEKRDQPGGRAYVYRQDGFTFDGGPTVITAPWLITELFALAGRRAEDYVTLVPIDPFYRIFFPDGTHFDYSGDEQRMRAEILRLGADAGRCRGLSGSSSGAASASSPRASPSWRPCPFCASGTWSRSSPTCCAWRAIARSTASSLATCRTSGCARSCRSIPCWSGGNPFQTTSIYTLIHYLEREWGVWFALGGTGAIVDGHGPAPGRAGRQLRLNAEVGQILVEQGRATGVRLTDGEELPADIVVCNADVAGAYAELLPPSARPSYSDRKLARLRYSMSLVVIYFGTDRQYRGGDGPVLAHHDIILGPRYEGLLTDIFTRKP